MSKPQLTFITVFITEGNPNAIQVTNTGRRITRRKVHFVTADDALAWCRKHRAALVYSPREKEDTHSQGPNFF